MFQAREGEDGTYLTASCVESALIIGSEAKFSRNGTQLRQTQSDRGVERNGCERVRKSEGS